MANPIRDELVATQPWILDAGFRVVRYAFSYKAMGSSSVELESDDFRVRFVRERGTFDFAEVAPYGERWWEFTLVIEAATGTRPEYDGTTLDPLGRLFRENMDLLKKALGPEWPHTNAALERRSQERLKELKTRRPCTPEMKRTSRRLRVRRFFRRYGRIIVVAAGAALTLWVATR